MKVMFISDIHGIKTNLDVILKKYEELECDQLVVLWDLYYIGPRNSMIDGYDISYVRNFLSHFSSHLICMRGNCDSDVDLMVSDFPICQDISVLSLDGVNCYLTHGDKYHAGCTGKIPQGSVLIYGHEHIPFIKKENGILCLNPGSISLPRQGFLPSYMIYDNCTFTIYGVDGVIIDSISI